MKRTLVSIVLFFMLCSVCAQASPIFYSATGIFSPTTPSNAMGFSGPNDTWSFSFETDSNPVVLMYTAGGFNFAFSDFHYFLNNAPVAVTASFIRFFGSGYGGGFEICFDGTIPGNCTEAIGSLGPQMFLGTTADPTLIPGLFPQDSIVANVDSNLIYQASSTVQASVPEPSMIVPFAIGVLALSTRRFLKKRFADSATIRGCITFDRTV